MTLNNRFKLSLMMFLEFFVWGSWYVTLGTFLGNNLQANGGQLAAAFSTQSIGAIVAPFIIGLIADRFFNAEKILGISHLIGAGLMYMMYVSESFVTFYPYVLIYMIIYMPTLALVNSVSFNQMKDPAKEFSTIRVWGTVGWIASGLMISFFFTWDSAASIGEGMLSNTFLMSAISSVVLGLFAFTLPKTPPVASNKDEKQSISEILGLDALKLLKDKDFSVFFLSSILICIPLAFYYQNANPFLSEVGLTNPTGKMTIGQVSEVLFLLLMPFFFKKFGLKTTLIVGMLAWVVRYVMFAFGDAGEGTYLLLIGIALHGICYDFFFVSGQIYTDSKAGPKYKSSAQGLITLATYGIGMLIGFWIAGIVSDFYLLENGDHVWKNIWLIPSGIALLVTVIFVVFFKDNDFIKANAERNSLKHSNVVEK
ncbi:nucleoside permease [Cyclobacterium marinum]|uniref:Nucleoside:H symporter n=1 Tax=Cyclobacterium marinum (strain ATCC 25205 / DSM 745 / LMG 13164 / NCIMB 1802) TaxID=880070 RepID=G0IYA2_CYCMS|nr:nucleoside permease [Cyclobacterium marinum]AEL25637.1 nucleoside:H symporter [Cyclobacterium marinum DSM 745]MBI0401067.1 nucleoside permease [Cyclobacterium marinum]MBR9775589.1 nucleoside permease [Cytophagales bacterium]|tara:strand:+ start:19071 stop:20345 length:1275 start_codon:yes stop_codon:yes gene_type:complete